MAKIRGRVTCTRTKLLRLENIDFPVGSKIELIEGAREELKMLEEELEDAKERRREYAPSSKGCVFI